jgi:hypothetical protein
VVMKSYVFWVIMSYSLLKVSEHFRWTYCLHLQGQRISQAKTSCSACYLLHIHVDFMLGLLFDPWRWRRHLPLKCQMMYRCINIMFLDIIRCPVFI